MCSLWLTFESVWCFIPRTYPVLSFHQQIKGARIPFPVYVLGHTDAPILWVNLERRRCLIALEAIIKRILDQAVEPRVCVRGFYL